ncbi:MAG: hypothetical protein UDK32_08755 [Adlercreutzia sp.]|nr:hypothetical protein [Adlercreutzia sp.]MEE0582717.1 hypothetical protein [Adlercreutzia sp.]
MRASMVIEGRMPSLNDYVRAVNANRFKGNAMKQECTSLAAWAAKAARMPRFARPVTVRFTWVEGNRRRDIDNVAFAKKFVLDGLVQAGVIGNDTPQYVTGFEDRFAYDGRHPRIIVEVTDEA